jgi:hypothetical protein
MRSESINILLLKSPFLHSPRSWAFSLYSFDDVVEKEEKRGPSPAHTPITGSTWVTRDISPVGIFVQKKTCFLCMMRIECTENKSTSRSKVRKTKNKCSAVRYLGRR